MRTLLSAGALVALAVSMPAGASLHECETPVLFLALGPAGGPVAYVVYHHDPLVNELWWGDLSLVLETNGISGMQFGGDNLLGDRAKCQMASPPDLLVY